MNAQKYAQTLVINEKHGKEAKMVTEQQLSPKKMVGNSDLKEKETPQKEAEVIAERASGEMNFAELMNPEFIAQFKGCWRW